MQPTKSLVVAVLATFAGAPLLGQTPQITRVSVREDGRQISVPPNAWIGAGSASSVSDDGRFVVISEALPLGPIVEGPTRLLDRVNGAQRFPFVFTGQSLADTWVTNVLLSADGAKLTATSYALNIPGGPAGINHGNIFLVDRNSGAYTRVTTGLGGEPNSKSEAANLSTNGRFVLYGSYATNLVPGDTNFAQDVLLFDAAAGTTTRASIGTTGNQSSDEALPRMVTDDGRFVLFSFLGDDAFPGDHNHCEDVFLRDLQLGVTELISVAPGGTTGNDISRPVWISADGRFVVFYSAASDLVAGDLNGWTDHFLRDRQTGTTTLITVTTSGAQSNDYVDQGVMPRAGRYLYFAGLAGNIVPGDTNNQMDLFVRDLQTGTTELLSVTPTGAPIPPDPANPTFFQVWHASADGRFLAFDAGLGSLIDGDTNAGLDGFLLDRQSPGFPVTTYCTAKVHSQGCEPVITSAGSPSASSLDFFHITASQVRPNKRGLLLWSLSSAATPFGGGTLCLGAPLQSGPVVASGNYGGTSGPCNLGQFAFHMTQSFMSANGLTSGTTAYAQFLCRDNGFASPNNVGLTDAIRFTVAP